MKGRIFIIHHAEIVREGLASIVHRHFNIETIQLPDPEGLLAYKHISNNKLILFYEENNQPDEDLIEWFRKKNDMMMVGFAKTQHQTSGQEHLIIMLKTSSSEIRTLIQQGFDLKAKPVSQPEGMELTRREKEVLKLVASGFSNKKIADNLFISTHTVISHRKKITEKTGIKSISGLTVYAILNKLIDTENINPEDLI